MKTFLRCTSTHSTGQLFLLMHFLSSTQQVLIPFSLIQTKLLPRPQTEFISGSFQKLLIDKRLFREPLGCDQPPQDVYGGDIYWIKSEDTQERERKINRMIFCSLVLRTNICTQSRSNGLAKKIWHEFKLLSLDPTELFTE